MRKRSYTETEFVNAVKTSASVRQALEKLGLSRQGGGSYRQFHQTIQKLGLDTSHFTGQGWSQGKSTGFKRPIEDYLTNKHPIQSHKLKLRLLKAGFFEPRCMDCQQATWQGQPIPLELDHLDGNHFNNRLENLRVICPNCHALTPNHAGKNKGQGSYSKA